MNIKAATALLALLVAAGHASAQSTTCAGLPTLTPSAIGSLFQGSGQYTCGSYGGESWNELHVGTGSSGTITDYKKGPKDPIDPTKQVGTYSVTSTNTSNVTIGILNDQYGAGHQFAYTISHNTGTSYNYCGQGSAPALLSITIQPTHC